LGAKAGRLFRRIAHHPFRGYYLVSSVVIEYWQENRQIPFGEEMSKLRTRLLRMFAEEYSILLKDDTELKNYLLMLAITTINKHLKSENKKRVSKLSF
jgi:hypothetical protein